MESHQTCLRDNGDTLDEVFVPLKRRFQGSNSVHGFGLGVRENAGLSGNSCRSSGNFASSLTSSSPATPGIASQISQDSGFSSAPSCESNNHNSSYLTRKTSFCSCSASSDAGCDSVDDSTQSVPVNMKSQASRLPPTGMSILAKECNSEVTRFCTFPEDQTTHPAMSDARSCNEIKPKHTSSSNGRSHSCKYSKYACLTSPIGSRKLTGICNYAHSTAEKILKEAVAQSVSMGWSIQCSGQCRELPCQEDRKNKTLGSANRRCRTTANCSRISCSSNLCWTPELPYSPSHSRASRLSSISCSHDSLVINQLQDDSRFIKEAVSHEVLSASAKKRRFKLFDPEIYSCPVDTLKPHHRRIFQPKAIIQQPRSGYYFRPLQNGIGGKASKTNRTREIEDVRVVVKKESKITKKYRDVNRDSLTDTLQCNGNVNAGQIKTCPRHDHKLCKINPFCYAKCAKKLDKEDKRRHRRSLSSNIRNAILALFTFRRNPKELGSCVSAESDFIDASHVNEESSGGIKWGKICPLPSAPPLSHSSKFSAFSNPAHCYNGTSKISGNSTPSEGGQRQSSLLFCLGHPRTNSFVDDQISRSYKRKSSRSSGKQNASKRALPPLPNNVQISPEKKTKRDEEGCDFASIIEKVKDYGWYWGPISGEAAEKVLSNEPDGSFIVRDSSDYHYIFSLTFRLNGVTRHVRIEHDQGNFSFGGFTRFKSQTIVDFIEKAVEHSRSGRYLFFLHRRPVLGPMRVQLLHPVSRFKHVQSLQHLCRFSIVNHVRRDLINRLPLPQRLKEYLSSPHYYSELVERCMSNETGEPDRQSPVSCLGLASGGENGQGELLGATALSPGVPVNLLPKQFSYQFVHGDDRSNFDGDNSEYESNGPSIQSPSVETPTLLTAREGPSVLWDMPKNTWQRSPVCQVASFYSSQSSYQYSATTSEYSPENPENDATDLLPCKKLHKCLSLGDVNMFSRKSAYISNNLLSALALETNAR